MIPEAPGTAVYDQVCSLGPSSIVNIPQKFSFLGWSTAVYAPRVVPKANQTPSQRVPIGVTSPTVMGFELGSSSASLASVCHLCLGATASRVLALFLALCLGVSPDGAQGPYLVLGIKLGWWLNDCSKASASPHSVSPAFKPVLLGPRSAQPTQCCFLWSSLVLMSIMGNSRSFPAPQHRMSLSVQSLPQNRGSFASQEGLQRGEISVGEHVRRQEVWALLSDEK